MKRLSVVVAMLVMTAGAWAQKATQEKQDEIIKTQNDLDQKTQAIEEKLDQVLQKQTAMERLYGSEMNMEQEITKMSYAYGASLAENFKVQGITNVDFVAFNRGIYDVLTGSDQMKMTTAEAQQFLNEYIGGLMAAKAQEKRAENELWFAENATKDGVKTTGSGLQYIVMKEGEGEHPSATSKVTVHYHGTLLDGRVFDSSVDRGKPASFGLNQVIPGWTEGVQLMTPGAKYKFFIPSDLGYGERGAGQMIGPNETLVFEVELISIDE